MVGRLPWDHPNGVPPCRGGRPASVPPCDAGAASSSQAKPSAGGGARSGQAQRHTRGANCRPTAAPGAADTGDTPLLGRLPRVGDRPHGGLTSRFSCAARRGTQPSSVAQRHRPLYAPRRALSAVCTTPPPWIPNCASCGVIKSGVLAAQDHGPLQRQSSVGAAGRRHPATPLKRATRRRQAHQKTPSSWLAPHMNAGASSTSGRAKHPSSWGCPGLASVRAPSVCLNTLPGVRFSGRANAPSMAPRKGGVHPRREHVCLR